MRPLYKTPLTILNSKANSKFEDKNLVWYTILKAGVSRLHVDCVRGKAINADIYQRKYFTKLGNFINTHHPKGKIMIWQARSLFCLSGAMIRSQVLTWLRIIAPEGQDWLVIRELTPQIFFSLDLC